MLAALGATLAPFLGAIPGSLITRKNIGPWYQHIKKPSWRPPNWAFGPVWTCLVILLNIYCITPSDISCSTVGWGTRAIWWWEMAAVCSPFPSIQPSWHSIGHGLQFFLAPTMSRLVGSVSCPKATSSKIISRLHSLRSVYSGLLLLQLVSTSTLWIRWLKIVECW